jgi:hypothetical protein
VWNLDLDFVVLRGLTIYLIKDADADKLYTIHEFPKLIKILKNTLIKMMVKSIKNHAHITENTQNL